MHDETFRAAYPKRPRLLKAAFRSLVGSLHLSKYVNQGLRVDSNCIVSTFAPPHEDGITFMGAKLVHGPAHNLILFEDRRLTNAPLAVLILGGKLAKSAHQWEKNCRRQPLNLFGFLISSHRSSPFFRLSPNVMPVPGGVALPFFVFEQSMRRNLNREIVNSPASQDRYFVHGAIHKNPLSIARGSYRLATSRQQMDFRRLTLASSIEPTEESDAYR